VGRPDADTSYAARARSSRVPAAADREVPVVAVQERNEAGAHVAFPSRVVEGAQEDRPQFPGVSRRSPGLTVASALQRTKIGFSSSAPEFVATGKVDADLLLFPTCLSASRITSARLRPLSLIKALDPRLFPSGYQLVRPHRRPPPVSLHLTRSLNAAAVTVSAGSNIVSGRHRPPHTAS
jgi:hypothetical protein